MICLDANDQGLPSLYKSIVFLSLVIYLMLVYLTAIRVWICYQGLDLEGTEERLGPIIPPRIWLGPQE